MYNPSSECGDETHTRLELYQKLKERNQLLGQNRDTHPHILPQPNGHYESIWGDYKPLLDQQRVDEVMNKVKLAKRPAFALENWAWHNYHKRFDRLRDGWLKEIAQIEHDYIHNTTDPNGILSIDRFHYKDVSYEWFVKNYESIAEPCMISGFTDDWPLHQWTIQSMNDGFLGQEKVKVGKDHSGRRVDVRFDIYAQYLLTTKDDSPVYLFESQIDRSPDMGKIFDSYRPPVWFSKDLLNYCHPERRPPHRWFCIGKKMSGTTMHVDPLGLLAWNSVISGRKLWIIFDKSTPEDIACGTPFMTRPALSPNIETDAVGWFERVWPKLKQHIIDNKLAQQYKPRLLIQYPGETIFVPGGLHHFVLNLDSSLAVTQNYCNMSNFGLCWREMRIERRHTALRWLDMLRRRFPFAYKVALELNKQDNFSVTLKKPHVIGEHRTLIDSLRTKQTTDGVDALTPDEKEILLKYEQSHDLNKVWGEEEAPFRYSAEWKLWSGSTDSSTDSSEESSSSSSSSDDSSDSDDSDNDNNDKETNDTTTTTTTE